MVCTLKPPLAEEKLRKHGTQACEADFALLDSEGEGEHR